MFCPYCGNKCEDDHRFCYRCGGALPVIPEEAAETADHESLCPETTPEILPEETPEAVTPELLPEITATTEEFPEEIPEEQTTLISNVPVQSEIPAPKKGRLWPPILAMVLMIAVGLTAFFLFPAAPASELPWFTVENGTLYFDESLYTGGEELTIPATVNGQTVTGIAAYAFADCNSIASVVIPDTVTDIGDFAFRGCNSLRGIYIPESVTVVGRYAFQDCSAMEAIYVCATLQTMGQGALDGCSSLRYIIYSGSYRQWLELYNGAFIGQVELHASDGVFYTKP